ncbi:hypothetical protein KIW84_041652 [Lathyrus oleraceus]|uniref:Uncharacterized protein n=1 Tax=Pisum sativum TaxID=3888 RepID=A0A9D4XAU0_PEA|nr:hypothetical protein KIW84_041652 [Pisum sativum]
MEMKSTLHIYVEHKGNVQEVEVCDVQEDEVGDVREDDVDDAQEDEVCDIHINDGGDVQEDENEDSGSSDDNDFEVDGLSFDDSEDEITLELDDCFEDQGKTSGGVDNEMDINYASKELGSSDHDASDIEKDPKYPRMKRWIGTHKCGRVLNNSSAKSKWVAKIVTARVSSSNGVDIRDIISEIRSNFFVGVIMSRT